MGQNDPELSFLIESSSPEQTFSRLFGEFRASNRFGQRGIYPKNVTASRDNPHEISLDALMH